jgi:hypothetical protein
MTQNSEEDVPDGMPEHKEASHIDVRVIFRVTPDFEQLDIISIQSWTFARAKRNGGTLNELTPSPMTRCCHFGVPAEHLDLFQQEVLTYAVVLGCYTDLRRDDESAITIEIGKTPWLTQHSQGITPTPPPPASYRR